MAWQWGKEHSLMVEGETEKKILRPQKTWRLETERAKAREETELITGVLGEPHHE